jgi:hypothetical protein
MNWYKDNIDLSIRHLRTMDCPQSKIDEALNCETESEKFHRLLDLEDFFIDNQIPDFDMEKALCVFWDIEDDKCRCYDDKVCRCEHFIHIDELGDNT